MKHIRKIIGVICILITLNACFGKRSDQSVLTVYNNGYFRTGQLGGVDWTDSLLNKDFSTLLNNFTEPRLDTSKISQIRLVVIPAFDVQYVIKIVIDETNTVVIHWKGRSVVNNNLEYASLSYSINENSLDSAILDISNQVRQFNFQTSFKEIDRQNLLGADGVYMLLESNLDGVHRVVVDWSGKMQNQDFREIVKTFYKFVPKNMTGDQSETRIKGLLDILQLNLYMK